MKSSDQLLKEEFIQKSAISTGDLAGTGAIFNTEQSQAFVDIIQEQPTILKEARVELVTRGTKEIDRIGVLSRVLAPKIEDDREKWVDPVTWFARERKATHDKIPLAPKGVRADGAISWETLRRNLEKAGYEDTILRRMGERAAYDLEDWGLNGDSDTPSSDPLLALSNGFFRKVPVANRISWGAPINDNLFPALISKLQGKYRRMKSQFRFYVSWGIEMAYRQKLAARGTTGGDVWLTEDGSLMAYGIRVVPCDAISDVNNQGKVLLAAPQNLIYAIEDEIRTTSGWDRDRDVFDWHLFASVDFAVEEVNALASADKVTFVLGGS